MSVTIFIMLLTIILSILFVINSLLQIKYEHKVNSRITRLLKSMQNDRFNIEPKEEKFVSSIEKFNLQKLQINKILLIASVSVLILLSTYGVSYMSILLGFLVMIMLILANLALFAYLVAKKYKELISEFPNALDLMARSIISGHAMIDAIKIVAENTTGILAEEFYSITNNLKLGQSLQESLATSSKAINLSEYHYFTIITTVQQKTGGNIAALLQRLATTLREKALVEKKIRSLSAEPIASATVVGTIPILVISIIAILNPQYVAPLIYQTYGQFVLLGCIVWQVLGVLVMQKIIKVDT